MNVTYFMLPTQAADAIILDGSILILFGVILSLYLLYVNRSNLLDTSLLPAVDIAGEENVHHQYEFEYNENLQTENVTHNNVEDNYNYDIESSEDELEEEYVKQEEEQKILIR